METNPTIQVLRGAGQSLAMVAAFVVAIGGAAAGLAPGEPEAADPRPYPRAVSDDSELWLVDGFNVLNAAILQGAERRGFWRSDARARLLERTRPLAEREAVCVVFDGDEPAEASEEGPARVVFAPSADDWLLRRIRSAEEPDRLTLVTADKSLGDRARHAGARVVSPREFLARCDRPEPKPV